MTHKEKQGLTVLAILLSAILASMWLTREKAPAGRNDAHTRPAESAMATDTAVTQLRDYTPQSESTDTIATETTVTRHIPHQSRDKKKGSAHRQPEPDRKSPLDSPVD